MMVSYDLVIEHKLNPLLNSFQELKPNYNIQTMKENKLKAVTGMLK
jgi:hypothetical protein